MFSLNFGLKLLEKTTSLGLNKEDPCTRYEQKFCCKTKKSLPFLAVTIKPSEENFVPGVVYDRLVANLHTVFLAFHSEPKRWKLFESSIINRNDSMKAELGED